MTNLFTAKNAQDVNSCLERRDYINFKHLDKTLFQWHCRNNNIEVVAELINKGCNIDCSDNVGTGFDYACEFDHIDIVKLLLEIYGYKRLTFSCRNSPIHIACSYGYCDLFDVLIEYGADPNERNKLTGDTCLQAACLCNQVAIVDRLLSLGVDVDKLSIGNRHTILYCQSVDVFRRLIYYVNVYQVFPGNRTLLYHYITGINTIDIVEELLNIGLPINQTDINGCSPLMHAVSHNKFDIVQLLLKHKADTQIQDNWGYTAKDYAKRSGYFDILALLN